VDCGHDVAHGVAVHGGVVQLGEDRIRAFGYTVEVVETLDDIHLPWRPIQVQRARIQARDGDAQLAPVRRVRQAQVTYVELQVEVFVFDPVRVVQVQWYAHQAAAEYR